MAQCFTPCGCSDLEGVSKSDLDRYTDCIENVLCEENGRKLFRGFMITCRMDDALKCLKLWEDCQNLTASPRPANKQFHQQLFSKVDDIIEAADKIDELDFALVEKLSLTKDSEDSKEIVTVIKLLKYQLAAAMATEYKRFQHHFTK